jgi:hypothetical protein
MADPLFVVGGLDPFAKIRVIGQAIPVGEKLTYTLERTATEIIVTVVRTTGNGTISGSGRALVNGVVTAPYEVNEFARIPTSRPPDEEPPPPPPPTDPPDIENWQPFAGSYTQAEDGSVTVTSDGSQTYVTLQSDDNYIPASNLSPTRVFTGAVRVKAANAEAVGKTAYLIYRQRNADNSTDTNDGDATVVLTTSYQAISSEFTSSADDRPMDLRLSVRAIASGGAFTVEALPESSYEEIDDPDPPPSGTVYERPFANSPLYRSAAGVGIDPQSASLVSAFLTACRTANSGRGPTVFFGEQRFESDSSDPTWTIRGASVGGSTTIRAPQNLSDQGGADPTIGIYDDANGKIVRLYGGASNPIDFDYTNRVAVGSNLGVDTDLDGVPNQGIGTAWGRMSGEGVLTAQDATTMQHRIKFALGNNLNARSFRAPARSFEQQAFGPAYPTGVPAGVTFVHLYTSAEILQAVNACFGTTSSARRSFAIAFWEGLSHTRGYGAVNGDGTGSNGINFYINYTELGLSVTDARSAVRLPLGNNTGATRSVLWNDSTKWRALVAG